MFQKRKTQRVLVNGVLYEVGPDASLAQDASYRRTLDDDFCLTGAYKALALGALAYMNVDFVDVLVVGLPVHIVTKHADALAATLTGVHFISGHDATPREIEVAHVVVMPQPIGTFFDHVISNNLYGHMKSQTNLVIDPGFYTFDWVVSHGAKPNSSRSGATTGGMSAVLAAIAESLSKEIGCEIPDHSRIDDAIRTGTNPRYLQREWPMAEHLRIGKDKARNLVATMANKVGNGVDLDNIIIGAGGAEFFLGPVKEKFPNHELVVAKEPIYSNVRGFLYAGEQMAQSTSFQTRRAG